MRKFITTITAAWVAGFFLFGGAATAEAGYDSNFTFGVGIHSGYFHAGAATRGESHRPVYGLNLRARMFRIIGLSMAYDLNSKQQVEGEVNLPYPTMQFAAHIYFMQFGRVSLNLLAGIGLNLGDNNYGSVLTSYILGTELAVRVHKHVEINAGLRFYLRSFDTVINQQQGLTREADGSFTVNPAEADGLNLSGGNIVQDIFDFRNFQLLVSVRAYI